MARYDFSHTIRDERLEAAILHDIDCEVEVSFEFDAACPTICIDAVYIDGANLFTGSTLSKMIAADIADAAESSEWLREKVFEDNEVVYRGMGGNDPDGHFVRGASLGAW